jgi:hypothetical protein
MQGIGQSLASGAAASAKPGTILHGAKPVYVTDFRTGCEMAYECDDSLYSYNNSLEFLLTAVLKADEPSLTRSRGC